MLDLPRLVVVVGAGYNPMRWARLRAQGMSPMSWLCATYLCLELKVLTLHALRQIIGVSYRVASLMRHE